jgi:hypothetical protein
MMETMSPTRLAELGRKLYQERFKDQYLPEHKGEVLAIDVESESAYLGKSVVEALLAGEAAHSGGFFHVVRIGSPGVYQMGFERSTSRDRIV